MIIYKNRYSVLFKAIVIVLVCLFIVNDIAWTRPANQSFSISTLAVQSRLNPFFEKYGLNFRKIVTVSYVASELRKMAMAGDIRESHIVRLNRKYFPSGEIEISSKEIEKGNLSSEKKYVCVIFYFKNEKKRIRALLLEDYAGFTPQDIEELKKFKIKNDADIDHLTCPGLEGVWFINPDATSTVPPQILAKSKSISGMPGKVPTVAQLNEETNTAVIPKTTRRTFLQMLAMSIAALFLPKSFIFAATIPTEYGLHKVGDDEFVESKPSIIFIHGARGGSPLDYEAYIKSYMGKYNMFVYSYNEKLSLGKISDNLAIEFREAKNSYKNLDKAAIVANSYGNLVVRKAVIDNNDNLFKNITMVQLVPTLGGSSETIGLYIFEPGIRALLIKCIGGGAGWHVATVLDPLGPTEEALFNKESCRKFLDGIQRTYILRVTDDPHSPGHIDTLQEMLTTKEDEEKFQHLYENGLAGASSIITYKFDTDNPHDYILESSKAIAEVERIVNDNTVGGKTGSSVLYNVERNWTHPLIENINRYSWQWTIEGTIILSILYKISPKKVKQRIHSTLRRMVEKPSVAVRSGTENNVPSSVGVQDGKGIEAGLFEPQATGAGLNKVRGDSTTGKNGIKPDGEPPKGSCARAIVTINTNKRLRRGVFTKDEFQKARKKQGDPVSDTTVYSELNGLITLGVLEKVNDVTRPYNYRLTDNYMRAPPGAKRKITAFLKTLPARPTKEQLELAGDFLEPMAKAEIIHDKDLELTPPISQEMIVFHIITASILPITQRTILQDLEKRMAGSEYSEKVVQLKVADFSDFVEELKKVVARKTKEYEGYNVRFDVACPSTECVNAVLNSNLGIKALAFTPSSDTEIGVMQVEGIILALRALDLDIKAGKIEALREAFKFLTGKNLTQKESAEIKTIDDFIKRIIFTLSITRVDYDNIGRLNRLMAENIESAA